MTKMFRYGYALLALLSCTAIAQPVSAGDKPPNKFKDNFKPFLTRGETSWEIDVGARMNDFDWNIASDITGTQTPNIISELTWDGVVLVEAGGELRHLQPMDISKFIKGGLHLEAGVRGGIPVSGDNQDSDYLGDNRTLEFSRSDNSGNRGYAIGASAATGYKIMLTGDTTQRARAIAKSPTPKTAQGRARKAQAMRRALNNTTPAISVTPLVGYTWDEQNYKITDGRQTIDLLGTGGILGDPDCTCIPGLDSEYTAEWWGPFLGLEGEIAGKKNMFRVRGEYQYLDYYAEAIWNLRTDLRQDPSFEHEAEGNGILLSAEYAYALDVDYELTLDASYHMREAEDGTSTGYRTTGAPPAVQQLNEVNDKSYALRLGIRHDW